MIGKRVIPRLRRVHLIVVLIRILTAILSMALFIYGCCRIEIFDARNKPYGIVGAIGPFFIVALANNFAFRLGRHFAARFGFINAHELNSFTPHMYHWPESWLEDNPLPDKS